MRRLFDSSNVVLKQNRRQVKIKSKKNTYIKSTSSWLFRNMRKSYVTMATMLLDHMHNVHVVKQHCGPPLPPLVLYLYRSRCQLKFKRALQITLLYLASTVLSWAGLRVT